MNFLGEMKKTSEEKNIKRKSIGEKIKDLEDKMEL
jgi:hypothetical protein